MARSDPSVRAAAVSWRIGYRWILKHVDFEVHPGEVTLLVGGNGSGKTSLLRLLAGLTRPTRGRIERRTGVGFVAHQSMLYEALTGRENLRFVAKLVDASAAGRVDGLLDQMGLANAADQRVGTYSRGMVQRLAIARALLSQPDLLLLDEPLTGLDQAAVQTVTKVLVEQKALGRAIVIATHQLIELAVVATSVAFLVDGEFAAQEGIEGRGASSIMERHRELVGNVG